MPAPRVYRGAILIAGGLYGNEQALEALLAAADSHRIPAARIILTGDLAAYCADGADVAEYCRRMLAPGGALIIRGNCERALAAGSDDCGCGFAPGSACSALSAAWYRHAADSIAPETKQWMGALPARASIIFGGRKIKVIHGGADADNTFIFASTAAAVKRRHTSRLKTQGVIAGHCGIPFTDRLGDALWHNSGAVGMPANDGTPRGWYSVWREAGEDIEIRHYPLHYDHAAAARAMQAAGLPPPYRETLASGVWPSDSILPDAEKQRQGQPLNPPAVVWRAESLRAAAC